MTELPFSIFGKDPGKMVHNEPSDLARKQQVATWIKESLQTYYELLDMSYWNIRAEYIMEATRNSERDAQAANCWTRWEYREAHITFNLPVLADFTREHIDGMVLHEIIHIFINPMRMWWPDKMDPEILDHCMRMEEKTVTDLTAAISSMKNKLQK